MKTTKVIPFTVSVYKPGMKVMTRKGNPVRVLATDTKIPVYPVVAIIKNNGRESVEIFSELGRYDTLDSETGNDLFIHLEVDCVETWTNVYREIETGNVFTDGSYASEQVANQNARSTSGFSTYLTSVLVYAEEKEV